MSPCACEFDDGDELVFSVAWHRKHRDHHLATFPDVDHGTRRNLEMFIEIAAAREAKP